MPRLYIVLGVWLIGNSLALALEPAEVLVVYYAPRNDPRSEGFRIWNYYQAARPGVRGMNLARYLPPEEVLSPGTVSYESFISQIRDPIRRHLQENGLENEVRVLVLTKNIPHRIDDLNQARSGDSPNKAHELFQGKNATFASVDSELTLLWQNLSDSESNGPFDSHADNFIRNPYFNQNAPISRFIPKAASASPLFERAGDHAWQLLEVDSSTAADAGWIILTARLDGESVDDIKHMIDRAQAVRFDAYNHAMIFDRPLDGRIDEGDFDAAASRYASVWNRLINDQSSDFIIGSAPGHFLQGDNEIRNIAGPIAFVASYGGNHSRTISQAGWESTFDGQLVNGAIFNTYESYSAKAFGGIGPYSDQAQLSNWIRFGGTFGLGHVWEPFASTVGRNRILLENFLVNRLSWVEAAWSSIEFLSWQNLVLGDPLAVTTSNLPPLVSLVALERTKSELESDEPIHSLMLTLTERVPRPIQIDLEFSGAVHGEDFRTTNLGVDGTTAFLTIPANQRSTMFTVQIIDDDLEEGLEVLTVALAPSEPAGQDGFREFSYLPPQIVEIPIAETAYHLWAYHGSAGVAEETSTLLWRYFLGMDPTGWPDESDMDGNTALNVTTTVDALSFTNPAAVPQDLRLSLESSADLAGPWREVLARSGNGPWETIGELAFAQEAATAGAQILTIPLPPGNQCFFQFKLRLLANP